MTISFRRARPPLGPTITMLAMMTLLLALGVWQVQRLAWKTHLIQALNAAYAQDPALTKSDFEHALATHALFLHGHVTGRFESAAQILVGPRTHDGSVGYHVLTPLRLDDGGSVLVNRGWIAAGAQSSAYDAPAGNVRITGLARYPDHANLFTPPDRPDAGLWYTTNIEALNRRTHLDMPPYVLYAERIDGTRPQTPLPFMPDWQLPNSHLQYAIFWFTMAGLLAVIFGLRFFIEPVSREKRG